MSAWEIGGGVAGGIGLFLLGMSMMTDGLKLAAGPALQQILAGATRTRGHALGSGILVTALVQSSSAVTVATIGFVNAGLLALGPALWVMFGTNVGTTMTSWIVALVGLKFNVEALALPLVGVGMIMKLTGEGQRRGALGGVLAGFGLLFMGIAVLQQTFVGLGGQLSLPQGDGVTIVLMQLGIGALMTMLMQSSSASMTIALTAAQSGLIGVQGAAAVVIGANIGTTVTALLASIGATPNARRAAVAHVAFNGLTGAVALLLLPWLVSAIGSAHRALGLPPDPATQLALFHTSFNVLGVLLMWPLAAKLTTWLQQRFRAREEDLGQPRYLDNNVLAVPALALDALERELGRTGELAVRMLREVLNGAAVSAIARDHAIFVRLDAAVMQFVENMNRAAMSADTSERLAVLLRVERYHETSMEQAISAASLPAPVSTNAALMTRHNSFVEQADILLVRCDPSLPTVETPVWDAAIAASDSAYEDLKAAILAEGATGRWTLVQMEDALRRYSAIRRAIQQSVKARQRQTSDMDD